MPAPPKGAKWTEPPKVITRLNFRSDRVGYTDDYYRHIFLIPADGGTARQITTGDWNYPLRPSRAMANGLPFRRCVNPERKTPSASRRSTRQNVATGEVKQLTHRNGTSSGPSYSPDGKLIAFMSADSTDHSAWAETKLWMMNADGTNAHVVSGNARPPDLGVLWAETTAASTSAPRAKGRRTCTSRRPPGQFRSVTSGKHMLTVASINKSGVAAGVRSTPTNRTTW